MTVSEELGEIRRLLGEIAYHERHRAYLLHEKATRATSRLSAVRHGGTPGHGGPMESAVLDATADDAELGELRVELRLHQRKIAPLVQLIPGGKARDAMRLRYLEGMSVAQTARRLKYNRQYMYDVLRMAEEELEAVAKKVRG